MRADSKIGLEHGKEREETEIRQGRMSIELFHQYNQIDKLLFWVVLVESFFISYIISVYEKKCNNSSHNLQRSNISFKDMA